jgi:hypothetical protein
MCGFVVTVRPSLMIAQAVAERGYPNRMSSGTSGCSVVSGEGVSRLVGRGPAGEQPKRVVVG